MFYAKGAIAGPRGEELAIQGCFKVDGEFFAVA